MEVRELAPNRLFLDPENPRIPSSIQGQGQEELFLYLHEHGVLSELVDSFVDNGFFANEPLLVVAGEGDTFTVIEGNRRLAALKWLLQIPPGDSLSLDRAVPPSALKRLQTVPVVVVEDRSSVATFLGFRHISGLKPWAPEAKARFIAEQVDHAARAEEGNPFSRVGRAFGSNASGMRNAYLAYGILMFARDELKVPITHVLNERFGVWTRCLNSSDIRRFIGLGKPLAYPDVRTAIENLDGPNLKEVISDLTPGSNGGPGPILKDSRQITIYGQVLASVEARKVLRSTRNLDAAKLLVKDLDLAVRLDRLAQQAAAMHREMIELNETRDELDQAAEGLFQSARKMRNFLRDLREDDE